MKTNNWKLYLTIFNEYIDGKGLNFARHGLNRSDILDLIGFYQRTLKPDILNTITLAIFHELLTDK